MQIFQTLDTQYPVTSYKLKQWVVIYMVNFQEQGQLEKLAGWQGGRENAKYRSECVGCLVTVKVREVRRRMVKVSWCLSLSCER